MRIHHFTPPTLFDSTPFGFSQVVSATGARIIAVAGQVGWTSALAAGGRLVRDAFAPAWWTLADPAGSEVDVATTKGRD